MNKHSLSTWQFAIIIIYPILSMSFGISTYTIINIADANSYFSIIMAYFLGIGLFFIFFFIFNYKGNYNVYEKNKYLFGNKIGTIINCFISLLLFCVGCVLLYHISDFIIEQFLSHTPMVLFMMVFGFIIVFLVTRGVVNIARVSVIFLFIIMLLSIISFVGLIPHFQLNNLMPIGDMNIYSNIIGSCYFFLIDIVPLFIFLIIPKKKIVPIKRLRAKVLVLYTIIFIIVLLDNIFTIGSLGIYLARLEQYPEYMAMQKITLFHFLDRIENVLCMKWFFSYIISISFIVYHLCKMFPKTNSKVSSGLIVGSMIIFSLIFFKNNTYFYSFCFKILPIVCLLLFAIYVIIALVIIKRVFK